MILRSLANTGSSPNIGVMLAQRLRRWPNNKPTLNERPWFAGMWCSESITYDILQTYLQMTTKRKGIICLLVKYL